MDPVCAVEPVHLPPRNTTECSNSGSCTGRCGGGTDDDCWCDDLCEMTGDCCCDMKETCATESVQDPEVNISSTEAYSTKQDRVSSTDQYNDYSTELRVSSTEKTTSLAGCISGCRTDSSGPKHDRCCVFPFVYEGVTHSTCVEVDGNKSWCSTKVDVDGVFIESEWGYCGDNCLFDIPIVTTDNPVSSSTEESGSTSKPAHAVTEEISKVDTTSPTKITTASSPTTTVKKIQDVSSTTTSTAVPTTTKTTKWVPYLFVFKAKPTK